MAIKYREAEELRSSTRKNLTSASENWMRFLRTASYTYKYSYSDQLLIAAQFPNATAVAAFDVWSDKFGRRIRKGEKGIGLIDNTGRYPKMRYVFDISQSDRYKDVPQPYVWDLQEEHKDEFILSLAGDLSISIEEAVSDFCENTVDSLIEEYENDVVFYAKESVLLTGMDDAAIRSEFRKAVLESVKYMALIRCGLPTHEVDTDVFRNLSDFSDIQITDVLGTAVSSISEQALREIETIVKTIERRNQYEHHDQEQGNRRDTPFVGRGDEDILSDRERGQGDRFDIYARSGNIRISPESDSNTGREGHRNLGTTQTEVSVQNETDAVYADAGRSQSDRSPDLGKRSGGSDDGASRRGYAPEGRREREAESGRLDGMGSQSELRTEQSGGNRVQQSDLQVKSRQKMQRRTRRKAEETVSPAFSASDGEQLSLFEPEKSEQDRANEYAMSRLVKHGTAFEDGKFRVQEFFSQEHTRAEKAKFLSDEFGWGGYVGSGESMDYRPGKGITMTHTDSKHPENNITVHLTYPQVADMIDVLIASDRYITPSDIEKRQQRAIYTLKNYNVNNPVDVPYIERAKAILDSYNIDYSQLLASQPEVETVTPEQVEEMNASISDDAEIPDINAPDVPITQEETVYSESAAPIFSSSVGEQEQVSITTEDIAVLQMLEPRKSVLNFTPDELAMTSVWSRRFASDIKEKSPFFRAENGEWRNSDESKCPIILVKDAHKDFKSVRDDIKSQKIRRGTVTNSDTNWNIQISRKGLEDSVKYGFKHKDANIYSILYSLEDIIEQSVLLDSNISERNNDNKAINTAFMHKLYSVCKIDDELFLAKVTVEEFFDGKDKTLRRLYNVQDIKIEPLRHIEFTENQLARSVLNGTEISVAELFSVVKALDKDFYLNLNP